MAPHEVRVDATGVVNQEMSRVQCQRGSFPECVVDDNASMVHNALQKLARTIGLQRTEDRINDMLFHGIERAHANEVVIGDLARDLAGDLQGCVLVQALEQTTKVLDVVGIQYMEDVFVVMPSKPIESTCPLRWR